MDAVHRQHPSQGEGFLARIQNCIKGAENSSTSIQSVIY